MKKKPVFLIATVFLVGLQLIYAQQITLSGQVSIHNSEYDTGTIEYVSKAFITASFGGADATDNSGVFDLKFVGKSSGTTVAIQVEKLGYEIVNKKDLDKVVIGRILPLKIYLAPIGKIDQARIDLYNISIKALTLKHDRIITQLRSQGAQSQAMIAELEEKLNREIASRDEAVELLEQQLKATKDRLPEIAEKLAMVNLDFASEMYREAYGYFRSGEIEKTIEALDEAVLDQQAEDSWLKMKQYRDDLLNLDTTYQFQLEYLDERIKSCVLQARILEQEQRYQQAVDMFRGTTTNIVYRTVIGQEKQVKLLIDTALFCDLNGEPQKAYYFLEKALMESRIKDIPSYLLRYIMNEKEEILYVNIIQRMYEIPPLPNLKN